MINTEKPSLDDAYLEHVGVKGMKWGVRKDRNSSPPSTKRKIAVKVGGALFAAIGAAVTVGILVRTGNLPSKPTQLTTRQVAKGRSAARTIQSRSEWKKSVNSVLKDIENANAEQDRWMRSLGLGAAVNNR